MGDDEAQNGPDVQGEPVTSGPVKPKGHGARFDRKMDEAIVALLTHQTVEAAARAIGVVPTTLMRWMKDPEFDAGYRAARRAAVGQSGARLQQETGLAVSVLLKVMVDSAKYAPMGTDQLCKPHLNGWQQMTLPTTSSSAKY